ncbi:hypothetical protein RND61_07170 [Streptomyces sp. TRM76323]|uniref:ParB/Sulfiredoxin domain-containing protein n=1 Tax=Streptomyces tamarix TaxID=3078565 RepID=A0ABU3QGK4_9ACTN|nr:hypothetical protein [Streptomyces tamarix]MDT9681854.1 hypothetical protein [Streptomyces tamarix]
MSSGQLSISNGLTPPAEIKMSLTLVTPELAREWIKRNIRHNRPISASKVKQWRTAIEEGRWRLTHQGIAFDPDGNLIDGQHRLMAIGAGDLPVWLPVFYGVPAECFAVLDINYHRSAANSLSIAGHKNAATLAATIKLIAAYDANNFSSSSSIITNEEHLALVEKLPGVGEATNFGLRLWKAIRIMPSSASAAAYITRRERRDLTNEQWQSWEEGIVTGAMLPGNDPRLNLREAMKKRAIESIAAKSASEAGRVKVHATRDIAKGQIATYILAFNAWIENRKPRSFAWNPNEDPMPTVSSAPFARRS